MDPRRGGPGGGYGYVGGMIPLQRQQQLQSQDAGDAWPQGRMPQQQQQQLQQSPAQQGQFVYGSGGGRGGEPQPQAFHYSQSFDRPPASAQQEQYGSRDQHIPPGFGYRPPLTYPNGTPSHPSVFIQPASAQLQQRLMSPVGRHGEPRLLPMQLAQQQQQQQRRPVASSLAAIKQAAASKPAAPARQSAAATKQPASAAKQPAAGAGKQGSGGGGKQVAGASKQASGSAKPASATAKPAAAAAAAAATAAAKPATASPAAATPARSGSAGGGKGGAAAAAAVAAGAAAATPPASGSKHAAASAATAAELLQKLKDAPAASPAGAKDAAPASAAAAPASAGGAPLGKRKLSEAAATTAAATPAPALRRAAATAAEDGQTVALLGDADELGAAANGGSPMAWLPEEESVTVGSLLARVARLEAQSLRTEGGGGGGGGVAAPGRRAGSRVTGRGHALDDFEVDLAALFSLLAAPTMADAAVLPSQVVDDWRASASPRATPGLSCAGLQALLWRVVCAVRPSMQCVPHATASSGFLRAPAVHLAVTLTSSDSVLWSSAVTGIEVKRCSLGAAGDTTDAAGASSGVASISGGSSGSSAEEELHSAGLSRLLSSLQALLSQQSRRRYAVGALVGLHDVELLLLSRQGRGVRSGRLSLDLGAALAPGPQLLLRLLRASPQQLGFVPLDVPPSFVVEPSSGGAEARVDGFQLLRAAGSAGGHHMYSATLTPAAPADGGAASSSSATAAHPAPPSQVVVKLTPCDGDYEAGIVKALNGAGVPHIPHVLAAGWIDRSSGAKAQRGTANSCQYLVLAPAGRPLEPNDSVALIAQAVADVAAALGRAAECGFFHRGVCPANVQVDGATGRGLLVGFHLSEGTCDEEVAAGGGEAGGAGSSSADGEAALYRALHLDWGTAGVAASVASVSSALEALFYTAIAVTSEDQHLHWRSASVSERGAVKGMAMYEPLLFQLLVLAHCAPQHRPLILALHAVFFEGGQYQMDVMPHSVAAACAPFFAAA